MKDTLITLLFLALSIPLSAETGCPLQIEDFNFAATLTNFQYPAYTVEERTTNFTIKVRNTSGKDVRGFKLQAGYLDATEDLHVVPIEQNFRRTVKDGAAFKDRWSEPLKGHPVGWVVLVKKILFQDGSTWTVDSSHVCYGERWQNKKHPRVTKLRWELFKAKEGGSESN